MLDAWEAEGITELLPIQRKAIDEQLTKFKEVKDKDLPEFNRLVKEQAVDAIILKDKKKKKDY